MKRIKLKFSSGTAAHLEVLTKDLLGDMRNKSVKELTWIIREAFTDGLIHCADLTVRYEKAQRIIEDFDNRKKIAKEKSVM